MTFLPILVQMGPQYHQMSQSAQQMQNRVSTQAQIHQQWPPMQSQQQFPNQQWNYQNNNYMNQNQYPNQYLNQYMNAQQFQWQQNQIRQMRQQFHQNPNMATNPNILTNVTNIANNTTPMAPNGCPTQEPTQNRSQPTPHQPSSVMPKCPPLPNTSVANTSSANYHQMNGQSMQKCQNQLTHVNPEVQCGSVESTAAANMSAGNRSNMRPDTYQRTLEYVYQHPMITETAVNCPSASPANVLSPSGSCKVTSSCPTPKPTLNGTQPMTTPMPQQCLRPTSAMSAMSCRSTSTQLSTNMVINDLNSTLNCLVEESRFLQMSIN